jgi:hypothetical protein
MTTECALNAERRSFAPDQISNECQDLSWQTEIRMLANLLIDIDLINRSGHMDPAVFGAIVSLVATHMDRIATELTLNAD